MKSDKELLEIAESVKAALAADAEAYSDFGRVIAANAIARARSLVTTLSPAERSRLLKLSAQCSYPR
jgi:hypothetical protein